MSRVLNRFIKSRSDYLKGKYSLYLIIIWLAFVLKHGSPLFWHYCTDRERQSRKTETVLPHHRLLSSSDPLRLNLWMDKMMKPLKCTEVNRFQHHVWVQFIKPERLCLYLLSFYTSSWKITSSVLQLITESNTNTP